MNSQHSVVKWGENKTCLKLLRVPKLNSLSTSYKYWLKHSLNCCYACTHLINSPTNTSCSHADLPRHNNSPALHAPSLHTLSTYSSLNCVRHVQLGLICSRLASLSCSSSSSWSIKLQLLLSYMPAACSLICSSLASPTWWSHKLQLWHAVVKFPWVSLATNLQVI